LAFLFYNTLLNFIIIQVDSSTQEDTSKKKAPKNGAFQFKFQMKV